MVNTKLFSIPKLMLLPQVIAKQPMLLIKITPLILLSDYVKSSVVSTITTEVERLNKLTKDVSEPTRVCHSQRIHSIIHLSLCAYLMPYVICRYCCAPIKHDVYKD
jgi:hypothetical protein